MNSPDGSVKADASILPAGAGGAISAYATNDTDVIFDINGYFVAAGSVVGLLEFYPVPPCRAADTRNASGPFLSGGAAGQFQVSGLCSVPTTARAYSLNITALPDGPLGYITA
jgi:hypothetical protein